MPRACLFCKILYIFLSFLHDTHFSQFYVHLLSGMAEMPLHLYVYCKFTVDLFHSYFNWIFFISCG